ncbi:MAG: hypothetical protein C3F02_01425 [Parcubacteria group bacterium]|nr:MAG: hypothetical protein C3F02_01425 [Parcubacteria group bacterium]
MISVESKEKDAFSYNSGSGYQYEGESSEIWVADFGSHDIEESLREEVAKLKPKTPLYVSWILTALLIFIVVMSGEWLVRVWTERLYWSEITIFWSVWLWRLAALLAWIYVARFRWAIDWRKFFIISLIAFILAVFVADIFKIVAIGSAWTWLNLLVDPIWMAILVAALGAVLYKLTNHK